MLLVGQDFTLVEHCEIEAGKHQIDENRFYVNAEARVKLWPFQQYENSNLIVQYNR
jgi:hypothetical protein